MFDLHGPNLVVDMGANSLFQSINVAAGFLANQDCKIVLAGGVNAARTSPEHFEGAFMMALTTPEIAKEHDLPIECYISIGEEGGVQASSTETQNYRGAHGMVEISEALTNHNGKPIGLRGVDPQVHTAPARPTSEPVRPSTGTATGFDSTWGSTNSPYMYVQGTPIYYYTPVMVPAEPEVAPRPVSLRSRKLLFLTDRPERWVELERSGALAGLLFQVLGPMETEEKLAASLDRLTGSFDTIIAVQSLDDSTGSSILAHRYPALPDLLFAVCKHAYSGIESQQVWVASVSLNAFRSGHLDPHTGLTAGFLKSLARELPQAACRIVNTDETSLSAALRQLEAEFGRPSDGSEICYRGGKRHSITLAKMERLADASGPVLDASSVVLATGGGRGVTAVLAEELLNRFQCTVIALGRTEPAAAPPHILAMDEAQLVEYEQQFYKDQIAQGRKKIIELKKEYKSYQSALEVSQTVRRLSALPGRFEYISTDLTNSQSVAAIVESVFEKYGRVDLVLHGAGVQVSKVLPKKSVRDFQGVVSAKLESLRHIYQACQKHGEGRPTAYHILTSAFSYMGNDGQEDYGAANETLNRLAAVMDDSPQGGRWTSVAWLGWAGIGMTRGLEYAALAAHRGLRGCTKEEGQQIFSELLNGRATAPVNIILADGEIEFYKVKTIESLDEASVLAVSAPPPITARKDFMVIQRELSAETAPYVWDHLVDGIPTMPGVFLIILIAEAALELRPNLKITAFEDAAFRRFVRMRREGKTSLRLHANVISEDADSTVVRVAILADFVHKSGTVLQKDVEQAAVSVRLASAVAAPPVNGTTRPANRGRLEGLYLEDPYLMDGSPVKLGGPFRSMQNIMAGPVERSAEYRLRDEMRSRPGYRYLNLIMLDALVRFGGIYQDEKKSFPIFVPEACRTIKIYYDFSHPDEKTFTGSLRFAGSNPHLEADRLTIGPVEAKDPAGRTLAMVDGGLCRRMGEARNGK
jgi:NAD(P)-dependent dehydrogenase (short-subunit alcohol dehydrogenase family)